MINKSANLNTLFDKWLSANCSKLFHIIKFYPTQNSQLSAKAMKSVFLPRCN